MKKLTYYMIILIVLTACEIGKVSDVTINTQPEIAIPFAQFTYSNEQLVSQVSGNLSTIDTFVIKDYADTSYLDIEGADLSDFNFNKLIVYTENRFPFGISFSVQFVTETDITEKITIANIAKAPFDAPTMLTDTINISEDLLESIKAAIAIKPYIIIDSLTSNMISNLTDENFAKLNLGIQTVVNINDTISIRNSN